MTFTRLGDAEYVRGFLGFAVFSSACCGRDFVFIFPEMEGGGEAKGRGGGRGDGGAHAFMI